MSGVSRVLTSIEDVDPRASEELLPLVYDELRRLAAARMARERPGQTLQATALVHEAFVRLVDRDHARSWDSRRHFFAAAAEAMRRILINRARDKGRLKRGGDRARIDLSRVRLAVDAADREVLALDEAIEKLGQSAPLCGQLVKLRFFAGLDHGEAAAAMGLSRRTADRRWAYARAWLYEELTRG